MKIRCLAFDQSVTQSGWCVVDGPPAYMAGLKFGSFESNPRDEHLNDDQQFDRFGENIFRLRRIYKPDFIAWERAKRQISRYAKGGGDLLGPAASGTTVNAAQLKLPELQGMLRGLARGKRLPYLAIDPKTWRKGILGNGNLSTAKAKSEAMIYCRRLGIPINNHNEAEAVCVGLFAVTTIEFRAARDEAEAKRAAA